MSKYLFYKFCPNPNVLRGGAICDSNSINNYFAIKSITLKQISIYTVCNKCCRYFQESAERINETEYNIIRVLHG